MNQAITKMITAGLAVIISVVLIVTATYAWTTLSSAPAAENIQISIGGGNTILLAPDIVQEVDGEVCHYPGIFNDTLIFSRFESYDYLKQVDSLLPVSTADGLNWFIPTYYDISDPEVQNGNATVGEVKPIEYFENDIELLNANCEDGTAKTGHYIYLDFWVLSPGTSYTLRVSRGDENGGSYLIELPKIEKSESGFILEETDNTFAASARIGFLVNTNYSPESYYSAYQNSRYYNANFSRLAGVYQEKNNYVYPGEYRFTIYEPNGFLTPNLDENRYVQTKPIGLISGIPSLIDISDRLTVQLKNSWIRNTTNITLESMLTAAIAGKDVKTAQEAETILYDDYLQGQFSSYITKGNFITNTAQLYESCDDSGKANETQLASVMTSGATDDVYIVKLEKNIPQRIRMFVWIEGQDADCIEMSESGRFALSLELAGSN